MFKVVMSMSVHRIQEEGRGVAARGECEAGAVGSPAAAAPIVVDFRNCDITR